MKARVFVPFYLFFLPRKPISSLRKLFFLQNEQENFIFKNTLGFVETLGYNVISLFWTSCQNSMYCGSYRGGKKKPPTNQKNLNPKTPPNTKPAFILFSLTLQYFFPAYCCSQCNQEKLLRKHTWTDMKGEKGKKQCHMTPGSLHLLCVLKKKKPLLFSL